MDFEHSNFALAREIIHSREKSKQFIHRSFVNPPPPRTHPYAEERGYLLFSCQCPAISPTPGDRLEVKVGICSLPCLLQ